MGPWTRVEPSRVGCQDVGEPPGRVIPDREVAASGLGTIERSTASGLRRSRSVASLGVVAALVLEGVLRHVRQQSTRAARAVTQPLEGLVQIDVEVIGQHALGRRHRARRVPLTRAEMRRAGRDVLAAGLNLGLATSGLGAICSILRQRGAGPNRGLPWS